MTAPEGNACVPRVPSLLSVAGFDPSSGAGVSQDLDVFFSSGFHGLAVPTAHVVQGMGGARAMAAVPLETLSAMLAALAEDHRVAGVKVGVLPSPQHAALVGRFLASIDAGSRPPVVLDPVLAAKNGLALCTPDTPAALERELFPLAAVVTPNADEAARLLGWRAGEGEPREWARALCERSGAAVVVTGGHAPRGRGPSAAVSDVFCDGREVLTHSRPRLAAVVHGTGCTLSSLLCVFLARGYRPREAFLAAERLMDGWLRERYRPLPGPAVAGLEQEGTGGGYDYLSPARSQAATAEKERVLAALERALGALRALNPVGLVPAVQMNLAYALPWATTPDEVAAFPGRIGVFAGRLHAKGRPAFGASSHTARLVLACMSRYPEIRSCLVARMDDAVLAAAARAGLSVREVSRSDEPASSRATEGKSLEFLMAAALEGTGEPPDAVCDRGEVGKEPIMRLFGRDPGEVVDKLAGLARCLAGAEEAGR